MQSIIDFQYSYMIIYYFKIREHFYTELKAALLENYRHSYLEINERFEKKNIQNMAINLEYKIFSNTKVANKYKFDVFKLVCHTSDKCFYIFSVLFLYKYNFLLFCLKRVNVFYSDYLRINVSHSK